MLDYVLMSVMYRVVQIVTCTFLIYLLVSFFYDISIVVKKSRLC